MVEMGRQVGIRTQWSRFASRPTILLQAIFDATAFWLRSRNWQMVLIPMPIVVVFAAFYFTLITQSFQSGDRIAQQYSQSAQSLVSTQNLSQAVLAKYDSQLDSKPVRYSIPEDRLRKLSISLQRVLQAKPNDVTALYSTALVDELSGNSVECQSTLAAISPDIVAGFAPAHAMIAAKLIMDFNAGDVEVRERLTHHLQEAIEWPEVDPRFLVAYSRLIENPKSRSKVIDLLKQAATRNPDYYLQLAFAARRLGFDSDARLAAEKALKHYETNIANNTSSTEDWLAISKCNVLLAKFTEAKKLLRDATEISELDPVLLRRELSEVFRAEFYATSKKDGNKTIAKLGLLESAASADPSNPNVAEDVSLLLSTELQPTVALQKILTDHIENNTATTTTYFNLSNEYAKRNKFDEAIRYLEMVLKSNPRSFEAQNNLALLLARHKPEQIERAVELIERAYSARSNSIEVIDTYGEILLIANRPMDAISKLTTSLTANKSRIQTRKLLIRAFDEAGLPEMAQAHRDAVKELEGTKK